MSLPGRTPHPPLIESAVMITNFLHFDKIQRFFILFFLDEPGAVRNSTELPMLQAFVSLYQKSAYLGNNSVYAQRLISDSCLLPLPHMQGERLCAALYIAFLTKPVLFILNRNRPFNSSQ